MPRLPFRAEFSKGLDNSVFRMLEHIENGHAHKSGGYQKQVEKIKRYLAKAVSKVQKWKLNDMERLLLNYHDRYAQNAYDGDDLASAIEGLLAATVRFREY